MSKSVLDKLRETFRPRHRLTPEAYLKKLTAKGLNADGTPMLDPVPLAPPIGYKKAPSMVEIVRDMVRSEKLALEAAARGFESLEESEDFDVDDEPPLLRSRYENDGDPELRELLAAGRAALAEKEKAAQEAANAKKATPDRKSPLPRNKLSVPPADGPDDPPEEP